MNTEIKILPLEFNQAFPYVTDQLQDGNTLSQELLKSLDFKKGDFFALLHPSADRNKIHEFRSGGILKENPLESVSFQGKMYSGRKKAHSIHQLALYLQNVLLHGQYCVFEDTVHHRSDPVVSEMRKYAFYFHKEVYLCLKEDEFSQDTAERMIHYVDAQWHYMNIISDAALRLELDMDSQQLQSIALKATLIVVGAYDMEGFVGWKKSSDIE